MAAQEAAAVQEGRAWQGRGRERDELKLWRRPRQRRGSGGSTGATRISFKPATGDDAATRSSPARGATGLLQEKTRRAGRARRGGAWRVESRGRREGKQREAAGKRERAAPAPAQVHACAMRCAAPRPPQSGPGPGPLGPPSPPGPCWRRTWYPAAVLLKSLSARFRKSGLIQDGHFFSC